jgi:hypothetical protein
MTIRCKKGIIILNKFQETRVSPKLQQYPKYVKERRKNYHRNQIAPKMALVLLLMSGFRAIKCKTQKIKKGGGG